MNRRYFHFSIRRYRARIELLNHGSVNCDIFQYISNKMQLYTVYLYLETVLHVSAGTSTHHQKRTQLYLQHLLFVRPLLLPAAIAAGSSNGLTNIRCCRYSCLRSWWWVVYHPKHVQLFPDKIKRVTLHLLGYILEYSWDAWTYEG